MHIYVIAESNDGPCKIGIAETVESRLAYLQCGNPRRLFIAHRAPIAHKLPHAVEQLAHALAGERHRMVGEWFDMPVSAAIDALAQALAQQHTIIVTRYADPKPKPSAPWVPRPRAPQPWEKRTLKPPSDLYRARQYAKAEQSRSRRNPMRQSTSDQEHSLQCVASSKDGVK